MTTKEKKRIIFIFSICCFFFLLVLSKAFYVQVINRKKLISYLQGQIFRTSKVYPYRGNIYDRGGSPLAINIQTYSIFTIPRNVNGDMSIYQELAKIVPKLSYKTIKQKIHKRTRYTWLARKITLNDEQVAAIKDLKGVYIEAVPKRLYPNHELLSQTIGFVGVDNTGLAGIEYLFDKELRGKPLITKYFQDAKGRPIKFESQKMVGNARDIHLTIDKDLQAIAEKLLKDAVLNYKALKGGIGVIDVSTGEILAIANYPAFDPNIVSRSKSEHRKLAFISDPFEPGSIFKTLTAASALEHKIGRPETNYYCERGVFRIGDHSINEAESNEKFEWLSLKDIVRYSSNIGITKVAFDLTFPRLKKTLEDFNIGKKTGIEIPGESRGIFSLQENVKPLSLSNISFGQGVATTGIQILAAYAAVANGGIYNHPKIIKETNNITKAERVLSEQTAKELTEMLVSVVEEGTGTNAKIPHFQIAGKTSTAQKPEPGAGYKGYVSGFIGFPVNVKNKFVIYVYIDDPQGKEYYGNLVAAPVFRKMAQYMLYKDKEFNQLAVNEDDQPKDIIDTVQLKSSSARLIGKDVAPNFLGLDKLSVDQLSKKAGVKIKNIGMGIAVSQNPAPGTALKDNMTIELFYSPPTYE